MVANFGPVANQFTRDITRFTDCWGPWRPSHKVVWRARARSRVSDR